MRRTLIIAAMLLPLPFAALPIVSVVVAPAQPYASENVVLNTPSQPAPAYESGVYEVNQQDTPLTLRTGDSYKNCPWASTTSIEG